MFDWTTWSVWLIGLIILVIWIIIPLKEFGHMRKRMAERQTDAAEEAKKPE